MKEFFRKLATKWFCMHEYQIVKTTNYVHCYKYLLICTKCGKTKVVKYKGWGGAVYLFTCAL